MRSFGEVARLIANASQVPRNHSLTLSGSMILSHRSRIALKTVCVYDNRAAPVAISWDPTINFH
jgi:hypothetical protein